MARDLYRINTRKGVRHCLSLFDAATPAQIVHGTRWYGDALVQAQDMSALYGWPVEVCAAIIAHLSPQTRWDDNVAFAFAVAEDFSVRPGGCMAGNFDRARAAILAHLRGDDPLSTFGPRAHKTRAFAHAILAGGRGGDVVVDVWMLRAILQGPSYAFRDGKGPDLAKVIKRVGVYAQCADVVRKAARARNVDPCVMQAVVWTAISGAA
jgi:hypothetical protein